MAFVKTHLSCPYLRHTVTVNLPEVESKFLEECPLLWLLMLKSKAEMENIKIWYNPMKHNGIFKLFLSSKELYLKEFCRDNFLNIECQDQPG